MRVNGQSQTGHGDEANTVVVQSNENETTQKVDQDAEQKQYGGGSDRGGSYSHDKRGKGGDNGDSGQKQEIDQDADLDNDTYQKNEAKHVGSSNGGGIRVPMGKDSIYSGHSNGSRNGGNEANTYVIQSNENETTQKVDQDAEQKQDGGSGSGGSYSHDNGKGGGNGDSGSQEQDIDQDADLDNDTEQKNEAKYVGSRNTVVNGCVPIVVGFGNYAGCDQRNEANTYVIQSNENETTQKVDQDAEQKQDGGSGSGRLVLDGKGGGNGDSGSQEQDIDQDADLDNDTEQKNEAEHVGSRNTLS